MKKLMVCIISLSLMVGAFVPLIARAENKYDGYTFDQLQVEYLAILEAMWKTQEWQEVEVPAGVYQVGVEIPAGEWTLRNNKWFSVKVGTKLDATKTEIESRSRTASEVVEMKDYKNGWTVSLTNGDFIEISHVVYFTVPVKGQGLTFK